MIPLTLSYSVGLNINKQTGLNPAAYSTGTTSVLEQYQLNTIPNAQEFNYPFYLASNATETIDLAALGFIFVKLVLIKSTFTDLTSNPSLRYTYTNSSIVSVIDSSFLFIVKEIPTTIPTRPNPDVHTITILNLSSSVTEGTLHLVGLKNP